MTRKAFIASASLLLLSGCATIFSRSTQTITVKTPGSEQSMCELKSTGFREKIWTPVTVRITKSNYPMTVTCFAPGNRAREIVINPVRDPEYRYNIFNLGLGAVYDYETNAMWEYPDLITVDFTNIKPQPYAEPEYARLLKANPEIGGVEEFHPGLPVLSSDMNAPTPALQPRQEGEEEDFSTLSGDGDDSVHMTNGGPPVGDTENGIATSPAPPSVSRSAAPTAPVAPKARSSSSAAPDPNRKSFTTVSGNTNGTPTTSDLNPSGTPTSP